MKTLMRWLSKLAGWAGLLAYLVAVGVFFFLLMIFIDSPLASSEKAESLAPQEAALISVHIFAGGDPIQFRTELTDADGIWVLSWIIHVFTWLAVPAAIGLVVANLVTSARLKKLDLELEEQAEQIVVRIPVSPSTQKNRLPDLVEALKNVVTEMEAEAHKSQGDKDND